MGVVDTILPPIAGFCFCCFCGCGLGAGKTRPNLSRPGIVGCARRDGFAARLLGCGIGAGSGVAAIGATEGGIGVGAGPREGMGPPGKANGFTLGMGTLIGIGTCPGWTLAIACSTFLDVVN